MGKKKPNLNRARNMDIDAWRERQVSKRLKERLAMQTRDFGERHGADTDEQLKELVRRKAAALRRMPHPLELTGGIYLRRRLGDWNRLAKELGVAPASSGSGKQAYQRLREKEALLFKQERKAIKDEKQNRTKKSGGKVPAEHI
ncbi:MAG: hypothetical protein ILP09_04420 [Oscillospiraceae bacterium]|nr:hypothetical protein [Oscillospiraceae bacterium]